MDDQHDSDRSSVISTSERLAPSDSDQSDGPDVRDTDTVKYRLPDQHKLRIGIGMRGVGQASAGPAPDEEQRLTMPLRDTPPVPPPKDTPPVPPQKDVTDRSASSSEPDSASYFNPYGLSRANSVYTLSRASLTSQLFQLTSIKLPNADHLAFNIRSIPTSTTAARALNDAARQIKIWIKKATEVLNGLNAEDDVEWAAAGGREGLSEVDTAIHKFESLIEVYVIAIEELQLRSDSASLSAHDLTTVVEHMEAILKSWQRIKATLTGVKEQVEIAMEWEELWNTVLGEIGQEMERLGTLVFEMEERRHRAVMLDDSANGLNIQELETIVEEAPSRKANAASNRFSAVFPIGSAPGQPPVGDTSQDDKNLLALFARMQPLRASLDFLPMRLVAFQHRGMELFPSGCEELDHRRDTLEERYKKLESDAEALRRELGEDRWVIVFRNAGRQALKMCESVERSMGKLRDALDEGLHARNTSLMMKKVENYEQKKLNYGPAIEKVLAIIDRGVHDRLTVNGEVLRLQSDVRRRWSELEAEMKGMDFVLVEMNLNKVNPLRDSVSTILSSERSMSGSFIDTPDSSPASSVILNNRKGSDQGHTTPHGNGKSRQSSFASNQKSTSTANSRLSSLPISRKALYTPPKPRIPSTDSPSSPSALSQRTDSRAGLRSTSDTTTITPSANKPRWNASPNMKATVVGHNFKPLSATDPSPYRRQTAGGRRAVTTGGASGLPVPSPLGKTTSSTSLFSRPGSSLSTGRPPSSLSNSFLSAQTQHPQSQLKGPQPKTIGPLRPPMIGPRALSPAPPPLPATPHTSSKLVPPRLRGPAPAPASTSQLLPKTRTPLLPPTTASQRRQSTVYANNTLNTPLAPTLEHTSPAAAEDQADADADTESPSVMRMSRPESRAASGRRSSMLPTPRGVSGGKSSRIGLRLGRISSLGTSLQGGEEGDRPRWKA